MVAERRQFMKTSAVLVASLVAPGAFAASHRVKVGAAVRRLFDTLSPEQCKVVQLNYQDERRIRADANFDVTAPAIGSSFYSPRQRQLVVELLKSQLSPKGYQRFTQQMQADSGGLSGYYQAFFLSPKKVAAGGLPEVQWLLTGRHITLRATSDERKILAGPRVYGHGEFRPEHSLYYGQMRSANALFQSLNPQQQSRALVQDAPFEEDVAVLSPGAARTGLSLANLALTGQRPLRQLTRELSSLFEPQLAALLEQKILGRRILAQSTVTFYRENDLRSDRQWDIWRLQGPGYTWHYRGAPHVHAYLNLSQA